MRHVTRNCRRGEADVAEASPGVHVRQDPLAQGRLGVIEELDRQPHALAAPVLARDEREAFRGQGQVPRRRIGRVDGHRLPGRVEELGRGKLLQGASDPVAHELFLRVDRVRRCAGLCGVRVIRNGRGRAAFLRGQPRRGSHPRLRHSSLTQCGMIRLSAIRCTAGARGRGSRRGPVPAVRAARRSPRRPGRASCPSAGRSGVPPRPPCRPRT